MTTFFFAGDAMLGRGIDQLMPQPSSPELYEPYIKDARDYIRLAAPHGGRQLYYRSLGDVWGDAAEEIAARTPELCIVNLETSITRSSQPDREKGIHYRMHPANSGTLTALPVHCAVLANNHVMDWGTSGLVDTLQAVERHGIAAVGAGRTAVEAQRPVLFNRSAGMSTESGSHRSTAAGPQRTLVAACAHGSSGVPPSWSAQRDRPGVWLLDRHDAPTAARIGEAFDTAAGARRGAGGNRGQPGLDAHDVRICSVHWGGNWGHRVPADQRRFAHSLIDDAGVDIVFGHSSHHAKALEVYRQRLILYGCGDFINDYEGIPGHELYRPELSAGYFAAVDPASGALQALEIVPFVISNFRLHRAPREAAAWLAETLSQEGARFNTAARLTKAETVELVWGQPVA